MDDEEKEQVKEQTKELINLEKEKRKTEKAKNGVVKTVVKTACALVLMAASMACVTWLFLLIFPQSAEKAFGVLKGLI